MILNSSYIIAACQMIKILAQNFSQLIVDTISAGKTFSPGLDLAREERSVFTGKLVTSGMRDAKPV